jgi:uncharacterized cupin superfamily protein
MVDEARLEETETGLTPEGEGWFVLNLGDATRMTTDYFGGGIRLEGDGPAEFKEIGVNVDVLNPGEPACLYHRESVQEDFLVLSGECLVIIEGQERKLRAWDFVHCPPGTNHVFVGAGDGPCSLLMIGVRGDHVELVYPVDETAARHGASADEETDEPREAYAKYSRPVFGRPDWTGVPWA